MQANIDVDLHALVVKETESFAYFQRRSSELGFDFCATGVQLPFPLGMPSTYLENNYPESWQQQYAQSGYLAVDPTIGRALSTSRPILWSNTFGEAQAFWEDARGHGLEYGDLAPLFPDTA